MEFEKIINNEVDIFFKRVEVNHIVCTSSKFYKRDIKYVDSYLEKSVYNKIPVNSFMLLNNINASEQQDQQMEYEAIENQYLTLSKFLFKKIKQRSLKGENVYALNQLIREIIEMVDWQISVMNYREWVKLKNPNENEDILYLLLNKERKSYRLSRMDMETYCLVFLEQSFFDRVLVLRQLKSDLVDICSKYLLVPMTNPVFTYTCSQADICALIQALGFSNYIEESQKLKAILLQLFNVSGVQYSKAIHEYSKRKTLSPLIDDLLNNLLSIEAVNKLKDAFRYKK